MEEKSTDIMLPKLYFKNNKIIDVDVGKEKKMLNRTTKNPFSDEDI
jgi:hypothetical protein